MSHATQERRDDGTPVTGRRGLLVVISGPSGVGKGTVVRRLAEHGVDLHLSTSVTTRASRPDETDGVEYHFVDDATFDRMIADGALLEWAEVHGRRYGTPELWVERELAAGADVVLEIDVQGAQQIRDRRPDALLVFLSPPSKEELARRLATRGTETAEQLAIRQADADREIAAAAAFDHVVVNDDLERCVDEVVTLIAEARVG